MMTTWRWRAGLALVLSGLALGSARADNLVENPGFEISSGGATHSTQTGITTGSAAAGWGAFSLSPSFIDTSLVASTDPFAPGGAFMIEVSTDGLENGIAQVPVSTFNVLTADIFVVSGVVHLFATANFGLTATEAVTVGTGWQHLTVLSAGANEVGIYAHAVGGAVFYVDNVVATVPEPATWPVLLGALALCGIVTRRGGWLRL
jgi:hypothetical protein